MTFNKEQMKVLAEYESIFTTAINAGWGRNPGKNGLTTIHQIYTNATGHFLRLDANCARCIYNILYKTGVLYFADKAEYAKIEMSMAKVDKVSKVEVKTRKRAKKEA